MKDSSKWKLKQIFQIFQAHCNRRGTTDIDLFVSRVSHFISRKLNPFSKRMDASQGSWKYQRKVCSSIFQPDWKSVEEKSDGPSSDLSGGNSTWKSQSWYPSFLQISVDKPILIPQVEDLLMGPKMKKYLLIEKEKLRLISWTVSGKRYSQMEFQKALLSLSQVPKGKVQSLIMNRLGEVGNNLV